MTAVALSITGCSHDTDLYQGPDTNVDNPEAKVANTFDFKTTQEVKLTVDYSAAGAQGAVYFDVYTENPVISTQESDVTTLLRDETIKPVYGGFSNR